MNQTKKRLHIIKLAISITDLDCIQLQLLKLSQVKADPKLQKILDLLQAKNYAQAQHLIVEYIDTPIEEILQNTSSLKEHKEHAPSNNNTQLYSKEEENRNEIKEIDFFEETKLPPTKVYENKINYDTLLSLGAEDILLDAPDSPNIDTPSSVSHQNNNSIHKTTSEENSEEETLLEILQIIPPIKSQTPSKIDEPNKKQPKVELTSTQINKGLSHEKEPIQQSLTPPKDPPKTSLNQPSSYQSSIPQITVPQKNLHKSSSSQQTIHPTDTEKDKQYQPIPSIERRFVRRLREYPPIQKSTIREPSVVALLQKIKTEPYYERDIENIIDSFPTLIEKGERGEVAKLLLILSLTPSIYAQFMFARALFKGEILRKNISEAYRIILELAENKRYPEAICDLGQLYEYGIGVEKDIHKAESFYEIAVHLGIKRAENHLTRIRKEHKGLFGRFKK